jgi:uncharacterized protein YnzC (UPF0291/DUF896 family)
MKYFKLFEQFVEDLHFPVNEASKWTKGEWEDLHKFANKLSKTDPKEFDPATYKGVQSAVMNIVAVTDSIALFGGDAWALNNKDKCNPRKWASPSWVDTTPEEADKGSAVTAEYIKACETLFQEGIKAIQIIDKGNGEQLDSFLAKLEADADKLDKMNKKMQKSRSIGAWNSKEEFFKEENNARWELTSKVYQQYASATSNKEAQDQLKEKSQKAMGNMK